MHMTSNYGSPQESFNIHSLALGHDSPLDYTQHKRNLLNCNCYGPPTYTVIRRRGCENIRTRWKLGNVPQFTRGRWSDVLYNVYIYIYMCILEYIHIYIYISTYACIQGIDPTWAPLEENPWFAGTSAKPHGSFFLSHESRGFTLPLGVYCTHKRKRPSGLQTVRSSLLVLAKHHLPSRRCSCRA